MDAPPSNKVQKRSYDPIYFDALSQLVVVTTFSHPIRVPVSTKESSFTPQITTRQCGMRSDTSKPDNGKNSGNMNIFKASTNLLGSSV